MRVNFKSVKLSRKLTAVCIVCGKKRTRNISSEQTVNPFNKNTNGTIKTVEEVRRSVKENLEKEYAQSKERFACSSCINTRPISFREKHQSHCLYHLGFTCSCVDGQMKKKDFSVSDPFDFLNDEREDIYNQEHFERG